MTDQAAGSGSSPIRPGDGTPEGGVPNPFSRQGAEEGPADLEAAAPQPGPSEPPAATYPPAPDPDAYPPGHGSGASTPDHGSGAADPVTWEQPPGGAQPYIPGPAPADPATPLYGPVPTYDPQQGAGFDQPYGQPPAYGQAPAYGVTPYPASYGATMPYDVTPVQHPQALPALITGILGVVVCPPTGFAGLILGRKARNEIDADPQRYTGRGLATAGFVLGIVGVAVTVLILLLVVVIGTASS